MKVLRRVCEKCGALALFSVEIICRPGTDENFGAFCPYCRAAVETPVFFADEIDLVEVNPEPVDVEAIRRSIAAAQ